MDRFEMFRNPRIMRTWIVGGLVVVGFSTCVHSAVLHAAPITLRFEAVVGPPRQGFDGFVPTEWNIALQQGDTVSGTFTFEPFDAPSNETEHHTLQEFFLTLKIQTINIATSRYELRATNDTVSDESPIPEDRIDFRCAFGGESACNPQTIPGAPNIEWAFGAAFVGSGDVLDGPDLPADVALWNQFSYRSMAVTFSDAAIRKSTGFIAAIESLRIVPEPSSTLLCSAVATAILASFRYRRNQREFVKI